MKQQEFNLPVKLAKPAQRALSNAGITSLRQLSEFSEQEISALHGIGQDALRKIREALRENGLSFSDQDRRS